MPGGGVRYPKESPDKRSGWPASLSPGINSCELVLFSYHLLDLTFSKPVIQLHSLTSTRASILDPFSSKVSLLLARGAPLAVMWCPQYRSWAGGGLFNS